jgi:hypothetical protein
VQGCVRRTMRCSRTPAGLIRREILPLRLSVLVVVVVMLPVRVLSPVGVLEMTPVAIGIAYPATWAAVN